MVDLVLTALAHGTTSIDFADGEAKALHVALEDFVLGAG
jgi:hypothetical protein